MPVADGSPPVAASERAGNSAAAIVMRVLAGVGQLPGVVCRGARTSRPTTRVGKITLACLLAILLAGGVLRLLFLLAWRPAFMGYSDSARYIGLARYQLWADPTREVGYPLFLRVMHALSGHLTVTIAVQHLFGLASATILFFAVRRARGPVWLGLLPAFVVALNGAEMFLEHSTLTESLFILLLSIAVYCAASAASARLPVWAGLAGVAFGLDNWVRVVALPLIGVLLVWLVFFAGGTWRGRLLATFCALLGLTATLLPYALVQQDHTGYFGLTTPAGAWNLYGRVAPFANCGDFTPPAGTAVLCESTPPEDRVANVEDYLYNPSLSPAYRAFGSPFTASHASDAKIAAFDEAVVLNQPLDYLGAVFEGMVAYIAHERIEFRTHDEIGPEYQLFYHEVMFTPSQMAIAAEQELRWWDGAHNYATDMGLMSFLWDYEDHSRVTGAVMAALMFLTFFAPFAPRGRPRQIGLLFFFMAWVALITPAATHWWDSRAAIPPIGPLGCAAAIGAWQLGRVVGGAVEWWRRRREPAARDASPTA